MVKKATNTSDVRIQNRKLIYHYIRSHDCVTKQDIVVDLGLSLPTVTQNLQFLEQQGLIVSAKSAKNTGGRSATAYSYNKDSKYAIGIYMTRNHLGGVCVDLSGAVQYTKRIRLAFNLEDDGYLRQIGQLAQDILQESQIPPEKLLGVGLAVPSLVSEDGSQVIYGLTYNFSGKTLKEIARYVPFPAKMYHDSYAAGFAEVWIHPSAKNAVYLNLNNSIGGSIIVDNQIYGGDNSRSGEIGHMIVEPHDGKLCYCGRRGCFDTVCNAGVLDSYTDGNLPEFFRLLSQGDSTAGRLWARYLDHLALALHNIRMLFDCTIILGGYVGAQIEEHIDPLYEKLDQMNCFGDRARDYVLPCWYKIEATAAGAAILLVDEFLHNV